MEWAGSSHLFCFSLHSGQTTCLFPASFPPSSSTLLVSLCFLFLCLYKQFLLLKFIPQSSHWNLVIPSQLGGGTESAESALEESYAIVPWEVGCVDAGAGAGGPVLGDGWELETLFSEGLACGQACGLLFCAGLVGSGRVKGWGLFALDKRSADGEESNCWSIIIALWLNVRHWGPRVLRTFFCGWRQPADCP